ncbi:MAG: helix-turn-helix domain-containing protein [bacterium]|jgi:transcriptional regulator with XRE-family HTH domain
MAKRQTTEKEEEFYKNLGKKIKKLREEKGISQKSLADFLKTSQQILTFYEKGSVHIPIYITYKIADFLGVSINYLLSEPGSIQEKSAKYEINLEALMTTIKRLNIYRKGLESVKEFLNNIFFYEFKQDIEKDENADYLEISSFFKNILERELLVMFSDVGIKVPFEDLLDRKIRYQYIINNLYEIYKSGKTEVIEKLEWEISLFDFIIIYIAVKDMLELNKK